MDSSGPTAVIAKYTIVRPPKDVSPETARIGFVVRPSEATELWEAFLRLGDAESTSEQYNEVAVKFLEGSREFPFQLSDVDLGRKLTVDGEVLAGYYRGEGYSEALRIIKDNYAGLFATEEKAAEAKKFVLTVWDILIASLVARRNSEGLGFLQRILRVLHGAAYLASLPAKAVPDSQIVNADVLLPPEVLSFIASARKDDRRLAAEQRTERLERARSNVRSSSSELILALAGAELLRGSIAAARLVVESGGVTELIAAGGTDLRVSSGREPSRAVLEPRVLEAAHPEVSRYLSQVLGVADLRTIDAIPAAEVLRSHAAALLRSATKSMGLVQIVESCALGEDAARALTRDREADLAGYVDILSERLAVAGLFPPSHNPLPGPPGKIKPAGFGDLRVVRQQLQKYELGEIAYVESVLSGEERLRVHNRRERTEQQSITEVEEGSETERDLQTTERFQLSQELEAIQKESRNTEAGVNVSASYGVVSVAAHAQTQSSDSAEQAQRNARNYMKETVSRAVERVQKRVRTEKIVTFSSETRETNSHKFSAVGTESRVGVYRYVEKHYFCQTLNYGSRLMIEFWVPEPSSYFTYAQQQKSKTEGQLIAPEKPNIDASNITDTNYLALAAKYNAEVSEPPAAYEYGGSLSANDGSQNASSEKYTVPDNWEIVRAHGNFVFVFPQGQNPRPSLTWFVGRHIWDTDSFNALQAISPPIRGDVTVRVMPFQTVKNWLIGISFTLGRTVEAYQKWQLETFNAIMLAYKLAKDEYDREVGAANQDSRQVQLRSEASYRSIEKGELRRGCLELLTNQHFDGFSSIDDANSIPTINNQNAEVEGKIVRFFEHSFEWDNVVYKFYPYYWARKKTWPARLSISDADPIHQSFLEAGYARVVVPVRKGYEKHIGLYLKTGDIWPDGDVPAIGDPEYLSIINEIKENDAALTANPETDGIAEGAPWKVVMPTPLVCLEIDKLKLPNWEIRPPGKPIAYIPSETLCDGLPYNIAQWPDAAAVRAELKALGYGVSETGSADVYLKSPEGIRIIRAFQRRANDIGVAARLGRPLRVDGIAGACSLRVLSVAADLRARGEWPGPGIA